MSSAPLSAFFRGRILSQLPKKDVPLFGRPSTCSGHNADLRQHITDWYDPSFGSTSHSLPPGLRGTLKRSHYLQSGHPLQGSGSWRTWKNHRDLIKDINLTKCYWKTLSFSRPLSIHVRNEPETRLVQAISNKYKPWIRQTGPQMFIQFTQCIYLVFFIHFPFKLVKNIPHEFQKKKSSNPKQGTSYRW